MTNWERSILGIHDEHTQFRFELTKYLNFSSKFNGYRYFWQMLPALRFTTEKKAPGFTNDDLEIYLSIPWEGFNNDFTTWEFVYYHECLHQMFETFDVAKRIKENGVKYVHKLLNAASDCIINDHLKNFCKIDYPNNKLITPEYLKEAYQIEYNVREDDQYTLYIKLLEKEKELLGDPLIMQEREGSLKVDIEGEGGDMVKTKKVKTTDDWKKGSKEARKAANDILQRCQNALNKKPGELLTVKEAIKALQDAIPDIQKLLNMKNSIKGNSVATTENFHVLSSSEFIKINEAEVADQIEDGMRTYEEGWNYAINSVLREVIDTLNNFIMSDGPKPPTPPTPPKGPNPPTPPTPPTGPTPPKPPIEQIVPENDPTEEAPFLPKPNRGKGKPQPITPDGNGSDDDNRKDPSEMTPQEASDSAQKDAKRAENAAQKAEQNAKDMQNNPNASQEDIDEANQNAQDARKAANNAKQSAQAAKNAVDIGDQQSARNEAQNARDAADEAEEKAGIRKPKDIDDMSGREAAIAAQKDAKRAKNAADKAQKVADQMKNNPAMSQEDKNEAQQKANDAKTAADNAQQAAKDASNAAAKGNTKLAQDYAKDAKDFADEASSLAKDNELSNMSPKDAADNARKDAQRAEKAASDAEKASNDIQNNPKASAKDKQNAKQNAQNARAAANDAKNAANKAQQAADNHDSNTAKQEAKNAKNSADDAQRNASDNNSIKNKADRETDLTKSNKPDKSKAKDFNNNKAEVIDNPNNSEDGVEWNNNDRDNDTKLPPGNMVADIKVYAEKLGDITKEEIKKIIKRFAQSTDNVLTDFVKKCSSAEKNQKGVVVQVKREKMQYSWAHQFSDVIKNTVRQKVSKRAKEYEATYKRPNRRQGIVHDNDIILKGQIPIKDRLTITIAFYVDCSGSMGYINGRRDESNEKNIFKFIYGLSDVISKKYRKNPIVDGCVFKVYAFNEEIKHIDPPYIPKTDGGTMELNRLMNNINNLTPDHMINVIITDAEMNFNINDIKNELKRMAGLCVFITNDSQVEQTLSPLNGIRTTKNTTKFKFIKVPGDFNISTSDFSSMKN